MTEQTDKRMKLAPLERESAVWKRIEAHLKERLEVKREKNDAPLGQTETDNLRGEIRMIKEILAWAVDDPKL